MKILIDNSGYELKNFGDIAMLSATIIRIKEISPDIEIFVFTEQRSKLKEIAFDVHPVDLKGRNDWLKTWNLFGALHRLFPHSLKFKLKKIEFSLKSSFPKLAYSIIKFRMKKRNQDYLEMQDFLTLLDSMDLVMATGGGFITDEFSIHAFNVLGTLYLAQKKKKNTSIIGQGLGPITDKELVSLCQKVFPNLDRVGLRESVYSFDLAISLGAKEDKVKVTGDDAIELAYSLRTDNVGENIGLNLRVAKYSNLNYDSIKIIQKFIKTISTQKSLSILPIAISLHEGDSDIRTLSETLGININESQFDSVDSVIKAISKCQLVITGSYHAGVFALSQGIPVIGVAASDYYRQKFEGLKNQFGAESCYIIDMSDKKDFLTLESIASNLIDKSKLNQDALLARASQQISSSHELVKELIELSNDKKT